MTEERGPGSIAQNFSEGGKPSARKISFDDFEIEANASSESESRKRSPIPRIKSLKDDLLGGGKRLSTRLFGSADDGAQVSQTENDPASYIPVSSPADVPYFSDEELSLVRVRKIPRPQTSEPPSFPENIEAPDLSAEGSEVEIEDIKLIEESLVATEPQTIADHEAWEEEEELVAAELFEEPVPVSAEVEPRPEPQAEEPPAPFLREPAVDPSIKVYLDTLRGFSTLPRRASDLRDPRKDYVLLLSELLDLLREQLDAMSALFFWTNTRKEQLVLECASLDDFAFQHLSHERRIAIDQDAVSRVATRGEPQLFQNIAPQAEYDLIPYYEDEVGIRSFAAMPVFFGDSVVAVLAVDSQVEDHFSPETLRIMANYSKVISGLVRSYIEAYDLLNSARTLKAARKLFQHANIDFSKRTGKEHERTAEYILRSLSESASELIEWQWLATVSFDETLRAWCISGLQAKLSDPYLLPKTKIDLAESIVGHSLRMGKSEHIDELTQQSIRFSIEEDRPKAVGHSFLVIPIRTASKNYGALVVEHTDSGKYTDVDIETLEHLARSAATSLEIFALSELVQERALTDILTGTLNKRGFKERFSEELARAKEYDEPLSLILFEIDDAAKFEERFAQEDIDTVILALTNILQFIKQPYDVLARIGEFTFAVLLIKMTDEDAFLWSEKVRQKIVSEVIALSRKSFTITTSIGVAGARRNSTPDELLICAKMALDKAKERGGNEVIVY